MNAHGQSNDLGFTILELLVALVVSITVSLSGWFFYRHELRELSRQSASLDAIDKVRAAIGFVSREIRAAGYDPESTALAVATFKGIREAKGDALHLEWDRNGSGTIDATAVDPNAESVRYSYDSAARQILRTVNGVTTPFVKEVPSGGFSLRYYDLAGNELPLTGSPPAVAAASRDLIALVSLKIRVETTGIAPVVPFTMASRVAVRARILDRL